MPAVPVTWCATYEEAHAWLGPEDRGAWACVEAVAPGEPFTRSPRYQPSSIRRCAECVRYVTSGQRPSWLEPIEPPSAAYQWVTYPDAALGYAHAIPGDAVLGSETSVRAACDRWHVSLWDGITVSLRVVPDAERPRCPQCATAVLTAAGLR